MGNNPVNYVDPTGHAACVAMNEDTPCVEPSNAAADDEDKSEDQADEARFGIPLDQGWRIEIDPPDSSVPGSQRHVHVYHGNEEVASWNKDGSVHDKGKPKGKVPGWVKDKIKEKTGIKVPSVVVEPAPAKTPVFSRAPLIPPPTVVLPPAILGGYLFWRMMTRSFQY